MLIVLFTIMVLEVPFLQWQRILPLFSNIFNVILPPNFHKNNLELLDVNMLHRYKILLKLKSLMELYKKKHSGKDGQRIAS